eukprot:Hpha_TRINITY_DN7655_c0_g1::TRINITY_DN7655_c0_g1_i1::g.19192::m.19192
MAPPPRMRRRNVFALWGMLLLLCVGLFAALQPFPARQGPVALAKEKEPTSPPQYEVTGNEGHEVAGNEGHEVAANAGRAGSGVSSQEGGSVSAGPWYVVVGASRGIGRAVATVLCSRGLGVVVT